MRNEILNEIKESIKVKENIINSTKLLDDIKNLAEEIIKTLKNNGKIIFFGNGGSFADAQHLTAEFISKLRVDRNPIPALALGTNSSNLTAIANDYGYEKVFIRELQALANSNDLLIPISTSGNSKNIISAIEYANSKSLNTIGLTGETGGDMSKICKVIKVPSTVTEKIQESHIMIGHIVCHICEKNLFVN